MIYTLTDPETGQSLNVGICVSRGILEVRPEGYGEAGCEPDEEGASVLLDYFDGSLKARVSYEFGCEAIVVDLKGVQIK